MALIDDVNVYFLSISFFLKFYHLLSLFFIYVFVANNIIKSDKVEQIMKAVDRGNYVSTSPYLDQPQGIGYGVTISAPHMVLHKIKYLYELKFKNY